MLFLGTLQKPRACLQHARGKKNPHFLTQRNLEQDQAHTAYGWLGKGREEGVMGEDRKMKKQGTYSILVNTLVENAEQKVSEHLHGCHYLQLDTERNSLLYSRRNVYIIHVYILFICLVLLFNE